MQQQNLEIHTLVDMYKRGELRLPEIQRHYVWRATRVRDLLDSLYRGYPSGSILMWETDEPVPTREGAIEQATTAFAGRKLLLDGQQRLTSLTAVLNGDSISVRGRKRPIDILFNLEHPDGPRSEVTEVDSDENSPFTPDDEDIDDNDENDETEIPVSERFKDFTFVVASHVLNTQPQWVSVSDVFRSSDVDILKKAGITSWEDPRFRKYSERLAKLRSIRSYSYVVHVLERAMNYQEVTEIFVRVNSLGAKLRSSDLALAQITSRWQNLLKELEAFQEECEKSWFTIDIGQLVRAIVVFSTNQCLFHSVGKIQVSALQKGWGDAKKGISFAINFLRTNLGIEDESLLSSPMFIHVIAAVGHVKQFNLTEVETQSLSHWVLVANARGHFSRGSTETLLNEDLAIIFRTGNIASLLEPIKRQFGRLHIEPSDLSKRGTNSPFFSLAYLALKDAGAVDWFSGLKLSLAHQGKLHYIQWHHIFPKSLLKDMFEKEEINEIANMAFISQRANGSISNKMPAEYLLELDKNRLRLQLVSQRKRLLELNSYRNFLKVRRRLLAIRMNQFIKKHAGLA